MFIEQPEEYKRKETELLTSKTSENLVVKSGKQACVLNSFSRVRLFKTPCTVACQASLSMGFFQARILEWVAIPPPGDLPDPRIKTVSLASPALTGEFFASSDT